MEFYLPVAPVTPPIVRLDLWGNLRRIFVPIDVIVAVGFPSGSNSLLPSAASLHSR
jgi:hypothetical protein